MLKYLAALAALLFAMPALAQVPPTGQATLNQAQSARGLTPNDSTTFPVTRGLHIAGDAGGAPCNISVVFEKDSLTTGSITLANLQPGISYPYKIKRLRATGTTCVSTAALY